MKDIINSIYNYSKTKSNQNKMKQLFNSNVFSRNNYSTISQRTFMASIAGFISYGLLLTFFMASLMADQPPPTFWFTIGVGLVLPLIGCFISMSDNFPLSLLGYHMIVIPIGLCLGPVFSIDSAIVQNAALLTALITGVMGVCGVIFPDFFKSIGGFLFYSLLALVIISLLSYFIEALRFGFIEYIAAGIFSLYIGYDMYRATQVGRTVGNALHIAVSLYLDILNLFLSLLSIFSSDND